VIALRQPFGFCQEGRRKVKQNDAPNARPCGHILHTDPPLYVLVTYCPQRAQPDFVRASCEAIDETYHGRPGNALTVFLSPFDAYLSAAYISQPGEPYHVVHAARFDPRELIHTNGGKLHISLHCGFGAHDGRLVRRRAGSIVTLSAEQSWDIDSHNVSAVDINLTDHDLKGYQSLRDAAGLFAHAESHAPFLSLPHPARARAVGRAIACMEGTVDLSHKANQCAIYDPEAGAWHFVPIGVFFDAQNEEACPS